METSNHKIFIIEDYMTLKIAEILKHLKNTVFISDVRSGVSGSAVNDFDIVWNTSMVYNWINVIQPELTMVKFRVPYYNEIPDFSKYKDIYKDDFKISKEHGTDFIKNYKDKKFMMSNCTLYIQTWKGPSSAEMRGYITKKDINNIVEYDTKMIENRLFYYNKILRMCYHNNSNANESLHFCNCNDCAIENVIWTNYTQKYKNSCNVNNLIQITNNITKRPLYKVHNNNIYDVIDTQKLEQMSKVVNKSTHFIMDKELKGLKGSE